MVERIARGHSIRVQDRVQRAGGTRVARRRRGNQPLVVEERAPERRLEELVGDRVVWMTAAVQVRVDRQCTRVIVPLRQADGVAASRVAILVSAVELIMI